MNLKFFLDENMYLIIAIFIIIMMSFLFPMPTFHSEDKSKTYTLPVSQATSLSIKKGSGTHEYGWIYLSSSDDLEISISLCEQQVEESKGKFFPMRLDRGGKITDLSCREFYERLFGEEINK